ncbi:hypothetical protein U9M48_028986 [Paspalum notatum var. saurae]|uniref:Serine-threonine/tyrosine-protein kinase catalytic domain-containing protein n=1 Tax=Paspalum notatum var. saurae TaxID=547442 RepID=A0AAQ3TXT1_PASNO
MVSDIGCSTIKDNLIDKGDVYSFGVVLIEQLVRKPRSTSKEEKNIAWIFQESIRHGTLHELMDKT